MHFESFKSVKYIRYYIIGQKLLLLSGRSTLLHYQSNFIILSGIKFITSSGDVIILSSNCYFIMCFITLSCSYYRNRRSLHYQL